MAKFKKGILGGFQGHIANVVGSSWKGKDVMKIRPAVVANPNTESQQRQRARFGMVGRLVQAHRNVIRVGFRAYTKDMTSSNAAMSYNLANAIAGEFPNLSIDYSNIKLSMGTLPVIAGISVTSISAATVSLSWTGINLIKNARSSDQLLVSMTHPLTGEVEYFPSCASRDETNVELVLPEHWSGRTVEVYLFLVSVDGNTLTNSPESVSNTVYVGTIEIN